MFNYTVTSNTVEAVTESSDLESSWKLSCAKSLVLASNIFRFTYYKMDVLKDLIQDAYKMDCLIVSGYI